MSSISSGGLSNLTPQQFSGFDSQTLSGKPQDSGIGQGGSSINFGGSAGTSFDDLTNDSSQQSGGSQQQQMSQLMMGIMQMMMQMMQMMMKGQQGGGESGGGQGGGSAASGGQPSGISDGAANDLTNLTAENPATGGGGETAAAATPAQTPDSAPAATGDTSTASADSGTGAGAGAGSTGSTTTGSTGGTDTSGVSTGESTGLHLPDSMKSLDGAIAKASKASGIDSSILAGQIYQESRGVSTAATTNGGNGQTDAGLMQVNESTFNELKQKYPDQLGANASLSNTDDNIMAGALYMKDMKASFGGDTGAALRGYNSGPLNVNTNDLSDISKYGTGDSTYVDKVQNFANIMKTGQGSLPA